MSTARHAAAHALMTVLGQGGYSNLVLDNILENEDLSTQDRSFCAALFYTTVQRVLTLDYTIAGCSTTPPRKLSPVVLACLRCGFCQLMYMKSVPESAAVNETVNLVKELGEPRAAGFVNGVMRGFIRKGLVVPQPKDPLTALSIKYSVPMPLIQLWRKSYGHEQAIAILEGLEAAPPIFLRVNTVKTTRDKLIAELAEVGLVALPVDGMEAALRLSTAAGGISVLDSFKKGLFYVQDLSSQLAVEAAAPKAGQRVLDLCSAPGGKAFTAAQLMGNDGVIVARDLYPARVGLVVEGAARLGFTAIHGETGDATLYDPSLGEFDLVLCDVVCSGFGIIRRKPEIRYKALETLDALPDLQYNILDTAAHYCKVGGRLVYSTCTLNPAENTAVVERFLAAHSNYRVQGSPVTIFPNESDGFFYTVMERDQ